MSVEKEGAKNLLGVVVIPGLVLSFSSSFVIYIVSRLGDTGYFRFSCEKMKFVIALYKVHVNEIFFCNDYEIGRAHV